MKIEIQKLEIVNFKGVRALCLDIQGRNASISGVNGTGKSTVADAWYWLISGKDSDNQANFNVLTLDDQGRPVDHQDAEVSADLLIDGNKLSLKKVYRQKWTKKRGQAEKEYTGNTTDHFIDDVPVSQKEYQNRLAGIIDDTLFRILSDVRFFNVQCKPDYRRNVLIDLCGDIAPGDILTANPDLAELDSIMIQHDLDDHKKILAARRRKINDRIDTIPELIKELQTAISDVSGYDEKALRKELNHLTEQVKDKTAKIGELSSGLEYHNLRAILIEKNTEMAQLEADTKRENSAKVDEKQDEINTLKKLLTNLEIKHEQDNAKVKSIDKQLIDTEAQLSDLKKQWLSEQQKTYEESEICFNCGQQLPDDMITEQQAKFNVRKAEKLRQIDNLGKQMAGERNNLNLKKDELLKAIASRETEIRQQHEKIESLNQTIHKINNENGARYAKKMMALQHDIYGIQADIDAYNDNIQPQKDKLKTAISALEDSKDVVNAKLLEITHADKTTKRIAELKKEQKGLSTEYQNTERELWLIEQYGRKKAEFIEENVSQHFQYTKWKLFEIQQNGGIRDICEATFNGVPYSTDLNNGARIMLGMDCINALSRHYDISVPGFVDNAESLTHWIDFPHQHIALRVSDVAELEVEIETDETA